MYSLGLVVFGQLVLRQGQTSKEVITNVGFFLLKNSLPPSLRYTSSKEGYGRAVARKITEDG
ncbi:hypothetical protein [Lewinella sp. LCG006]|uniref:hypothetical protein n=1 Tax=Lewinella sp. LCG006 TaxID=3231911 RepID=UPI0034614040